MAIYDDFRDVELLTLLKNGNKLAFASIFKRYNSLLYSHVYKKIRDREEAKDIIQEVFTMLWLKRDQINLESNLGGYLMMAVKHKVLDLIGHKNIQSRYFDSLATFAISKEGFTDHRIRKNQMQDIINKEINALPPKMRTIFLMSRMDELSHKQIAQQLNISEETVSTQIKRALKVLRIRLGILLYLMVFFKF